MSDLFDRPGFYDAFHMYYEMSRDFSNRPSQRHKYRNNDKQKKRENNLKKVKNRKKNKLARKVRKAKRA